MIDYPTRDIFIRGNFYKVSTEEAFKYIIDHPEDEEAITFDNQIAYCVPESIFNSSDEEIATYILDKIDSDIPYGDDKGWFDEVPGED